MPKSGEHRVNSIDSFFRVRPSSQNIREGENISFLEDGKLIKQEKRNGVVYEQVYVEQNTSEKQKSAAATGDVTNLIVQSSSSGGGDITGITAGTGLTGGGASGNITLNVVGGTGITANANDIAIDSTVATLTGTQTLTNKSIDLDSNTLTGTLTEFNTALQGDSFVSLTGTETLTNKTLAAPTFTGTANGASLTLTGDLQVNGTTTTVNQTNLNVSDNIIGLNRGVSNNTNDSGLIIERGSAGNNAAIIWDESEDKFTLGTTTAIPSDTGNLTITAGTLVASLEGNVTGDVTGSLSGGTITSLTSAIALSEGGTGGGSASEARTNLGLAIGTNVQAYDAGLASIAGLTTAANKMIYTTASDTYAVTDLTSTARTLLDDTSTSAMRTTLGVDAAGTDNSTDVTLVTTSHDYLSISGQAITLGQIDISDDTNLAAVTNGGIALSGDSLKIDGTNLTAVSEVLGADGFIFFDNSDSNNARLGTVSDLPFTNNSGTVTNVVAGTGLSGGGTTTATLDLDFSELTDMTGDISGSTEFILQNGTTESRKAASEIDLSAFNNDITDNNFTNADHSKLDGIEASATADQTASEILTAIKTVDGATSGLDADLLDGQHGSHYLDAANLTGTIDADRLPSDIDISSNTNLSAGTNITLSGDTLNVDDAFLINSGNDTTSGTITAAGFTTAGSVTADTLVGNSNNTNTLLFDDDQSGASNMVTLQSINHINVMTDGNNNATGDFRVYNGSYDTDTADLVFQVNSTGKVNVYDDLRVPSTISHTGDTDTYISFTNNRIRLYAGGSVKVDTDDTYLTSSSALPAGNLTGSVDIDRIPTAAVTNGDTDNVPTADHVYDFVTGQGYLTSFDITTQTDPKYLRSNAADTASGVITFSNRVTSSATGGFTIGNYAGYDRIQNSSNSFSFLTDGNAYAGMTFGTVTAGTWQGTAIANAYVADLPASKITSGELATARVNWDSTDKTVRWNNGRGYHGNPRSMAIGYSGSNYGQFGYNIEFTTTSGQHTYSFNDIATRVDLYDGIQVYTSDTGGTAGSTISWTELLDCRGDVFQYKNTNIALLSNGADNRVVTSSSATNLNGESTLTYGSSVLEVQQQVKVTDGTRDIRLNANHSSNAVVGTVGSHDFNLMTANTFRMKIHSDGLVRSINNHVFGAENANSKAYIRANNGYSTASTPDYTWWYNDTCGIFHPAANTIAFSVGSNEMGRFTTTGLGIGTTSPSHELVVRKDHSAATELSIVNLTSNSNAKTNLRFRNATSGSETGNGALIQLENGNDFKILNQFGNALIFGTSNAEKMRMDSSGNVGIGTTTPDAKLEVSESGTGHGSGGIISETTTHNGNAGYRFRTNGTDRWAITTIGTNGGDLRFRDADASAERMRIDSSGNVGIGTTTPGAKLTVRKDGTQASSVSTTYQIQTVSDSNGGIAIQAGSSSTAYLVFGDNGDYDAGRIGYKNASHDLCFFTNNAEEMVLDSDGDLHVDRDVVAFSTTPSDKRLKTNIQDINYGLETIMKLSPKQYDWKKDDTHDIGFIAQEVEEVIPEIVKDKKHFDKEIKTLDYEKLTAVLIKAVQEQQERINKLEEKLNV